ncbi:2-phospho-L-lactate guanylyltransferase [Microbacterium sp. CFBP9034]|uniref:2-phospho-L-lactate guanylyltransferase n=1 Tax=Microbacterium sp. CFBP9034 TaxID=3096540 RepID=UPI002A6996FD|nr:2-phospho-L-lactate guanylyltransferase [Microbacterium sp. CFBP9034]MDY0908329.1 2-phospho-L-lactate guanylyltransferase [Microbacterium sp. CFBP9034]
MPSNGVSSYPEKEQAELRHIRWIVVVPVKPSSRGKSRLEVPGIPRAELARAIALDTLAAATACDVVAQVVVVTDDPALAREAASIPALRFVPEGEARGLDAAVASGFSAVDPNARMPRAALLGDVPSLRPADLAAALGAAASVDRGVVADAEGTGSTLVTALAGVAWSSSFGDGSFGRHTASGCLPLQIPDASTLHRDVDTAEQLGAAVALGVGPRTAALLGSAR